MCSSVIAGNAILSKRRASLPPSLPRCLPALRAYPIRARSPRPTDGGGGLNVTVTETQAAKKSRGVVIQLIHFQSSLWKHFIHTNQKDTNEYL